MACLSTFVRNLLFSVLVPETILLIMFCRSLARTRALYQGSQVQNRRIQGYLIKDTDLSQIHKALLKLLYTYLITNLSL